MNTILGLDLIRLLLHLSARLINGVVWHSCARFHFLLIAYTISTPYPTIPILQPPHLYQPLASPVLMPPIYHRTTHAPHHPRIITVSSPRTTHYINQPPKASVTLTVRKVSHLVSQSVRHSVSQTGSQIVIQSISQKVSRSICQPVKPVSHSSH